jgi:hypothetical protein
MYMYYMKYKLNTRELLHIYIYISVKEWKIYKGKMEVVSLVIKSDRQLIISVNFEVNVKKRGR